MKVGDKVMIEETDTLRLRGTLEEQLNGSLSCGYKGEAKVGEMYEVGFIDFDNTFQIKSEVGRNGCWIHPLLAKPIDQ